MRTAFLTMSSARLAVRPRTAYGRLLAERLPSGPRGRQMARRHSMAAALTPAAAPFEYVAVGMTLLDVLARPVEAFPPGDSVRFVEEIRLTPAGTAAGSAIV